MATAMKVEVEMETCAVCGGGGELLTPEEHDAGAVPLQAPLRSMLLHLNNNKVIPDGRLCISCVQRTIESYEFSTALSAKTAPPLSEKIRALRRKLYELTQKIDVFIVVGGPGVNSGGSYSEEDIIMVERDALAAAAAADDEDLESARNACGETVYQCTVCPQSFQRASEYRAHQSSHPATARHSCWTCGAQFTSRGALADHAALHAAPVDRACHICHNTYQTASEFRAHEARCAAHCPECSLRCTSRAALRAHVARAHALLCAQCFRREPTRAALAAHQLAHRRADRFVCGYDACVLRFAARSELMAHIRKSHSGEAAHTAPAPVPPPATTSCPHCTRTFGSVAAMKRHIRVHRRERQPSQEGEWRMEMVEVEGSTGEAEREGSADDNDVDLDGDVEYLEVEALEELEDARA